MDLEKLRLARSLYYQCLGELFASSLPENRSCNLKVYLEAMQESLFDESSRTSFETLSRNLQDVQDLRAPYKEYDEFLLALKNTILMTFPYVEEGSENLEALLSVRQILAKSTVHYNEKILKKAEDSAGLYSVLVSEFLRNKEDELTKVLSEKAVNQSTDESLMLILSNPKVKPHRETASTAAQFIKFERYCFEFEKPTMKPSEKAQNDLSRFKSLRREVSK